MTRTRRGNGDSQAGPPEQVTGNGVRGPWRHLPEAWPPAQRQPAPPARSLNQLVAWFVLVFKKCTCAWQKKVPVLQKYGKEYLLPALISRRPPQTSPAPHTGRVCAEPATSSPQPLPGQVAAPSSCSQRPSAEGLRDTSHCLLHKASPTRPAPDATCRQCSEHVLGRNLCVRHVPVCTCM